LKSSMYERKFTQAQFWGVEIYLLGSSDFVVSLPCWGRAIESSLEDLDVFGSVNFPFFDTRLCPGLFHCEDILYSLVDGSFLWAPGVSHNSNPYAPP
jgi:hypothetical protein